MTVVVRDVEVRILTVGEVGPPGPPGPPGPAGSSEENMPYAKRVDFVDDDHFYKGEAAPGSSTAAAVWRISYNVLGPDGDVTTTWAGGTGNFDKVWDNRLSLLYT